MLLVRDWMMDLVVFIDPDASVSEAIAIMRRRYIHSLIVNRTETNPDYGILTSTDISDSIIALDRSPAHVLAREIMNSPLVTVSPLMTLKECAALMDQYKIHHLPVADEHGNLVGMISATDFLAAAEEMGRSPGGRQD
jgi:CBS domain-containing protein